MMKFITLDDHQSPGLPWFRPALVLIPDVLFPLFGVEFCGYGCSLPENHEGVNLSSSRIEENHPHSQPG
ncbi:MAG: hypothetical protein U5K99_00755 [Anaerolineales bacterium]|nr:hypothetical protein [Anaerolineales bacterium]